MNHAVRLRTTRDDERRGAGSPGSVKDSGRDPTATPEALAKRSRTTSAQMLKAHAWNREHGAKPDKSEFVQEILPQIQDVPLRRLMEETGLSLRYCSMIRRGTYLPHARHWEALLRAAR